MRRLLTTNTHGCGEMIGVPDGIRTRVIAVKGRCPRPLDDGDACAYAVLPRQGYAGGAGYVKIFMLPHLRGRERI